MKRGTVLASLAFTSSVSCPVEVRSMRLNFFCGVTQVSQWTGAEAYIMLRNAKQVVSAIPTILCLPFCNCSNTIRESFI
jgi:hypothetical protein